MNEIKKYEKLIPVEHISINGVEFILRDIFTIMHVLDNPEMDGYKRSVFVKDTRIRHMLYNVGAIKDSVDYTGGSGRGPQYVNFAKDIGYNLMWKYEE